jgi:hypothetical protein
MAYILLPLRKKDERANFLNHGRCGSVALLLLYLARQILEPAEGVNVSPGCWLRKQTDQHSVPVRVVIAGAPTDSTLAIHT